MIKNLFKISLRKLVAKFGFDINKSEFWRIGIEQVAALVDEFVRG